LCVFCFRFFFVFATKKTVRSTLLDFEIVVIDFFSHNFFFETLCEHWQKLFLVVFLGKRALCALRKKKPKKQNKNGSYQADRTQIYWRQSTAKAASHKGCTQICASHRRRKEAAPLPPWNCRVARNSAIPEEYGTVDSKTAVPETRARNCARF
jgi:hypothetical protein